MNLFITLLENVNKSRTSANNVSLKKVLNGKHYKTYIHVYGLQLMWLCRSLSLALPLLWLHAGLRAGRLHGGRQRLHAVSVWRHCGLTLLTSALSTFLYVHKVVCATSSSVLTREQFSKMWKRQREIGIRRWVLHGLQRKSQFSRKQRGWCHILGLQERPF
jgi:hypothetical protein